MDYRIFHRASVRVYRWVRRKWRYRPSNMRRLREEQQDINAIAAGTDRDDFYMDIIHDLLSEIPPDKENEDAK